MIFCNGAWLIVLLFSTVSAQKGTKLFQGDIKLGRRTPEQFRNALADRTALWPQGRIPYTFGPNLSSKGRETAIDAFKTIENNTCIKFVQRIYEPDFAEITATGDGCYSFVGRQSQKQEISIDFNCARTGIIVHELLHLLGFFHEQSRTDRDEYVRINYENMDRQNWDQFEKFGFDVITDLGTLYDYESIMHYGEYYYSINDRPTITPLKGTRVTIGQRDHLSPVDIYKINRLYGCSQTQNPANSNGKCEDQLGEQCGIWADRCSNQRYMNFLSIFCPKTCNMCSNGNNIRQKPVNPNVENCADTNAETCNNLKIRYQGCTSADERIRQFATINCQATCGLCNPPAAASNGSDFCRDDAGAIACSQPVWLQNCKNPVFQSFLQANCAASCGFCTPRQKPALCQDNDQNCPVWVRVDQRNCVNYEYIKVNCHFSCNTC